MKKAKEAIERDLTMLIQTGIVSPEAVVAIKKLVDLNLNDWENQVTSDITKKIQEWESSMGPNDPSFYSLGLRRSIDVIKGENLFEQLPVLEKPDTPDEKN
jgi:hypothetical protein